MSITTSIPRVATLSQSVMAGEMKRSPESSTWMMFMAWRGEILPREKAETRNQKPEGPSLGFLVSGFWFLPSGFWFLVSDFGDHPTSPLTQRPILRTPLVIGEDRHAEAMENTVHSDRARGRECGLVRLDAQREQGCQRHEAGRGHPGSDRGEGGRCRADPAAAEVLGQIENIGDRQTGAGPGRRYGQG